MLHVHLELFVKRQTGNTSNSLCPDTWTLKFPALYAAFKQSWFNPVQDHNVPVNYDDLYMVWWSTFCACSNQYQQNITLVISCKNGHSVATSSFQNCLTLWCLKYMTYCDLETKCGYISFQCWCSKMTVRKCGLICVHVCQVCVDHKNIQL